MQPKAQGTWSTQMAAQANASAPPPTTPQQCLTIMLRPQSPTEILLSQSPHQKGVLLDSCGMSMCRTWILLVNNRLTHHLHSR